MLENEQKEKEQVNMEDKLKEDFAENTTSQEEVVDAECVEAVTEDVEVAESMADDLADIEMNDDTDKHEKMDSKSGKSIFKKEKKKDKRDQQIEDLNDRLMRTMAEFDNFRKRSEKEKSQMFEIGAKDIIEKVLPVIDNFERGLGTITEEEKEGAFAQGIEKIYKQLVTTLEEAGVMPIEAVGMEFDPNLHNAVMHAEDDNFGENVVAEEFQRGYSYRDTVVRHSMVKVVN